MNTAANLTRLTMIVAALAAAITVQAAPAGSADQIVELPTIVVTGKRPVTQVASAIVELPMVVVTGKRVQSGATVVAQKATTPSPTKVAAPV